MKRSRKLYCLLLALCIAALLAPAVLHAQSCALCYQSAAAAGPRAIAALRSGILILIFPPLFICIGITCLAYRRRDLHSETA